MPDHQLIVLSNDGLPKIKACLENLRVDLGASGAMLLTDAGQLLIECGRLRGFDLDTFLGLLGKAMSTANDVARLLRDEAAFDLHYHEGHNYEMYSARLSDQVFLTLVLERGFGTTSRIGMVWLTLRRAVTDLRALVKQATVVSTPSPANNLPASAADDPPARPRPKLPGRGKPQPEPPIEIPSPSVQSAAPGDSLNVPAAIDDDKRVLTYEEARKLGLINLDDLEADS